MPDQLVLVAIGDEQDAVIFHDHQIMDTNEGDLLSLGDLDEVSATLAASDIARQGNILISPRRVKLVKSVPGSNVAPPHVHWDDKDVLRFFENGDVNREALQPL